MEALVGKLQLWLRINHVRIAVPLAMKVAHAWAADDVQCCNGPQETADAGIERGYKRSGEVLCTVSAFTLASWPSPGVYLQEPVCADI